MTITAVRYSTALLIRNRKTGATQVIDLKTDSDRFAAICDALKAQYPGWHILEPGPCTEVALIADAG